MVRRFCLFFNRKQHYQRRGNIGSFLLVFFGLPPVPAERRCVVSRSIEILEHWRPDLYVAVLPFTPPGFLRRSSGSSAACLGSTATTTQVRWRSSSLSPLSLFLRPTSAISGITMFSERFVLSGRAAPVLNACMSSCSAWQLWRHNIINGIYAIPFFK